MRKRLLLVFLTVCSALSPTQATPLRPEQVPEPLKPWVEWVLQNERQYNCPFLYNSHPQRRCAWPLKLELILDDTAGAFATTWKAYRKTWVPLPGDFKQWPQAVFLDGEPGIVTFYNGRPALYVEPGEHEIFGKFSWNKLPKSLSIPQDIGIVELTVKDHAVRFPDINAKGTLWLQERDSADENQTERLQLQVHRRIVDDIPMRVITRITLDVSGKHREVLLGKATLQDFIPLQVNSPLPARLEPNGRLRVQVRPGHWTIELVGRHPSEVTTLTLEAPQGLWSKNEIWVFEAHSDLRLVEIEGLSVVDPRQTTLPENWRQLPAYQVNPGDRMLFKVIRRGDPEPEPDRLSLQRDLWLDFDGGGYTVQDHITGSVSRNWRLDAQEDLQLGQVSVDNRPQFITRLITPHGDSKKAGIEVRRGALELVADSRYHGAINRLNATGWDHDFQQLSATLNLPPGWSLFAASGADQVQTTWLQRWTLLDLFMVLIATLTVGRLWGWPWALLALASLTLTWHTPGAPRYIWLHLLATIALLRVLPSGRFHWFISSYRNICLGFLVLLSIPFMINQVRTGLYPQLERPWHSVMPQVGLDEMDTSSSVSGAATSLEDHGMLAEMAEEAVTTSAMPKSKIASKALASRSPTFSSRKRKPSVPGYADYDPNAQIQTGPGLPQWNWQSVHLTWNGPVEREQDIRLVFISPTLHLLLNLLRVVFLAAFGLLLFGLLDRWVKGRPPKSLASLVLAGLLPCCFALTAMTAQNVQAELPDQAMLEELKSRLLEAPECLPHCAQIPRMRLHASADQLEITMEVLTQETVAIPLPARPNDWLPAAIRIDDKRPGMAFKSKSGELWLVLPKGAHSVTLEGPIAEKTKLQIPLPLKPRQIHYTIDGWQLDGVHEDGPPDNQLQLTRSANDQGTSRKLKFAKLPPFATVERTLRLGLEWQVETRVRRTSPTDSAIVLQIPLLVGESVTSEDVRVEQGKVLVNLSARQREVRWQSVFKKRAQIQLTAPDTQEWIEVWRADVSPIWHMETQGLTVTHHWDKQQRWLPLWRPWPGETVTLALSRPRGVAGPTLTIDSSRLEVRPGQRATDSQLQMVLRSSQGGQHQMTLPNQAKLQSVSIDGRAQPIRQEGQQVTLPIHPGRQQMTLTWRQPSGIGANFQTPQIDLGTPSVNSSIDVTMNQNRWILLTLGPRLGPAVLFWGVLVVVILVALALAQLRLKSSSSGAPGFWPLGFWHWLLLGIGLSQAPVWASLLVVGWLLALAMRVRLPVETGKYLFNATQIGLVLLTLAALGVLFDAIRQGLLGLPAMQIAGNGSTAYHLQWYQDRSAAQLPQARIISVPLLVYRLLMLAWALWLAYSLLNWLRWAWECYSSHGLWRSIEILKEKPKTEGKAIPAESS